MRNLIVDAVYDMVDTLSERKRPCDMTDVLNYQLKSNSTQEYKRIGDYYLTHLLRKIVKDTESHHDKVATLEGIVEEKDTQLHYQEKIIKGLRSQVKTLNGIVEEKDEQLNEKACNIQRRDAIIDSIREQEPKGWRYFFCDIPNKPIGKIFVRMLKKYLNKESYKIRVKGQYLDDETKKTEGWKKYEYGQPIGKSKCLRVYIDKV